MTDITPQAHARFSPSGSKRWFACPGSLVLERAFPDKANVYSDDGTAMHDVAASALLNGTDCAARVGEAIVVSHAGEPERAVLFTESMAALAQGYVDYVRRKAQGKILLVEQRVEFSRFVAMLDQFGTADAIIVDPPGDDREIDCTDLKTGRTFVDAEENSQAMIYLLGVLSQLYEQAQAAPANPEPEAAHDDEPLW